MITHEYAEDRIEGWLHTIASDAMPERAVAQAFDRTRRLPQRSSSRPFRAFATRSLPVLRATSAVAVVVVLMAVLFGPIGVSAPIPFGERPRGIGGVRFGPEAAIASAWVTDDGVAFTVRRDPSDRHAHYYWRAVVFDTILEHGATWGQTTQAARPAGASLLAGLADDVERVGRRTASFTVTPVDLNGSTAIAPAMPIAVDRASRLVTVGWGGYFTTLEVTGRGPYTVTASVPDQTLNAAALRATGTDYPPEVVDLYTSLPSALFGPNLRALEDEIVATAESPAPIDVVTRALAVLQSRAFTYDVDVRDIDCGSTSAAECFATFRRGYCEHYAAAMLAILRDLGIPARLVEGFVPGQIDLDTGIETVFNANAHAWVEVFFPGPGWIEVDPTPPGSTSVTNVDPSVR